MSNLLDIISIHSIVSAVDVVSYQLDNVVRQQLTTISTDQMRKPSWKVEEHDFEIHRLVVETFLMLEDKRG